MHERCVPNELYLNQPRNHSAADLTKRAAIPTYLRQTALIVIWPRGEHSFTHSRPVLRGRRLLHPIGPRQPALGRSTFMVEIPNGSDPAYRDRRVHLFSWTIVGRALHLRWLAIAWAAVEISANALFAPRLYFATPYFELTALA